MDKNLRIGYTCRKGLKPESPNQDSWAITQVDDNFSIYAVYDGHGGKGHDVSNFVKDTVPKLILKDPRFRTADMPAMLLDVFKTTQEYVKTMDQTKQLSAQMAGTTATVVIHDKKENQLTVAHVADSTCVLGKYKDASKTSFDGIALTRDHKPDLQDERRRIEKAGGRVVFDGYANYRVYAKNGQYPGLNMSRCLGDLLGHQDAGCSAEPETSVVKIEPLHNALLLCSDGVWEFIKPDEAVKIVMALPADQAQAAADKLAKEAWDRWIHEEGGHVVDDITVVLVHLNV
jgi:serine/threonine protein phosphatase PrpC